MKKNSIVSDPKILGGMSVIAGTRVPIARILYLLKEGETLSDIQEHFPHVSLQKLENVLLELAENLEITAHETKTY